MLRHTKHEVIDQRFLQHVLFFHVCDRSLYIVVFPFNSVIFRVWALNKQDRGLNPFTAFTHPKFTEVPPVPHIPK